TPASCSPCRCHVPCPALAEPSMSSGFAIVPVTTGDLRAHSSWSGTCPPRLQEYNADSPWTPHRSGAKAPEGDDAMNKKTSADRLAKLLGIPKSRGLEAVLKAQLIAAVLREIDRRGLTHAEPPRTPALPEAQA